MAGKYISFQDVKDCFQIIKNFFGSELYVNLISSYSSPNSSYAGLEFSISRYNGQQVSARKISKITVGVKKRLVQTMLEYGFSVLEIETVERGIFRLMFCHLDPLIQKNKFRFISRGKRKQIKVNIQDCRKMKFDCSL